jgi:hypothetical protein
VLVRPIDHIVLPCADLAGAAATFERLGFLVGPRNRHPWGTENQIVQFPGAFLELIALAPDYRPLDPDQDAFPFAGFLAGAAQSARPSGMVVLRSEDAAADAAEFVRRGLGAGRRLDFARDGVAPDGSLRTVAFSLAFADAATMPDIGFFVCRHHHPENFWAAAAQCHPNGVLGLSGIVIVAENPSAHAEFLGAFSGQRHMAVTSMGIGLDTGGGTIEVLTPVAYKFRYGASLDGEPAFPRLAALRFAVSNPNGLSDWMARSGADPLAMPGSLVRPPDADIAVALAFERQGQAP